MVNKIFDSLQSAVADIHDGATVMIGGFGTAGMPSELIDAFIAHDLTRSSTTMPATARRAWRRC